MAQPVQHPQGTPRVRARTTQEQRSRRTRQLLADAAIQCLVETGIRGTTFVEVCRRAGLTRGAAHHHYRDLPALLLDALRRVNARLEEVGAAVGSAVGVEDRIDAGIDSMWRIVTSAEFKAVVEIWVAQSHDPALAQRIKGEMDHHVAIVTRGFARQYPDLVDGNADALDMMRLILVTLTGLGFVNATIRPQEDEDTRLRLKALLKRIVQREFAAVHGGARSH